MLNIFDLIADHAREFLQDDTSTLIGILDIDGNIIEGNKSLNNFLPDSSKNHNLFSHLVEASRIQLDDVLDCARKNELCYKVFLDFNFEGNAPVSYVACVKPMEDDQIFFFAEPASAAKNRITKDYIQITNQFADMTRELQETRQDLIVKEEKYKATLKELKRIAICDGLTGIYNRCKIMEVLGLEIERAIRYRTPLAILMLDLDHFKYTNDRFGHQVGDLVLKRVAETMEKALRKVDIVGRYGGEEFMVILPQTDIDAAKILAERLRSSIEGMDFEVESIEQLCITASLGIAVFDHKKDNLDTLVNRADKALYWAKDTGRNRSVAL